jgi:hypothetical protein
MVNYLVWNDEIGFDDAIEITLFPIWGEEDAIEGALENLESDSYFVDGYPQSVVYYVQNEEGNVTKYYVDTEFEPCFVVTKKENEK